MNPVPGAPLTLVVLISNQGSNLQAIIDATITLAQLPERSRIDSALARIKVREERAR